MIYLYAVLMGCIYGVWRRWYGSDIKDKWLGNRGVQATAFCLVTLAVVFPYNDINWLTGLIAFVSTGWLYGQYFSRGHGCAYDVSRAGQPDEVTIKRYNERWYHIPCDWLFADDKYGLRYDFTYMFLRYTCPMIIIAFVDIRYLLAGVLVAPVYAICWRVSEIKPNLFINEKLGLDGATSMAEYIVGFIFGYLLLVINV